MCIGFIFSMLSTTSAVQNLKLSRGLDKVSTTPRIAFDPETGFAMVVYTQLDINDASYGRVYAVLLKLKSNGLYNARKPVLLSDKIGWDGRAGVIFVPSRKQFLVVWDTGDPTQPFAPADIIGRWVKLKNGKPKGAAFTIVSDNRRNLSPAITTPNYSQTEAAPRISQGEDPVWIMSHTVYKTQARWHDPAEHFGTMLSYGHFSTKIIPKVKMQLQPLTEINGVQLAFVSEFLNGHCTGGNGYHIALRGYQYKYLTGAYITAGFILSYLVAINPVNALLVGKVIYPNFSLTPRMVNLGLLNNQFMLLTTVAIHGLFLHNYFTKQPGYDISATDKNVFGTKEVDNADFIRVPFRPSFAPQADEGAKPILAWQIYSASDGWVYRRKIIQGITGKPKASGAHIKLFNHKDQLQYLTSRRMEVKTETDPWPDALKQKHNAIVVWQKKVSATKHELNAFLFTLK